MAHGMKVWRKALTEVRSAAQLAMCIQQLQKSIAWERSIMKVVRSAQTETVYQFELYLDRPVVQDKDISLTLYPLCFAVLSDM